MFIEVFLKHAVHIRKTAFWPQCTDTADKTVDIKAVIKLNLIGTRHNDRKLK